MDRTTRWSQDSTCLFFLTVSAHIEDICIIPEYQGKGYGKKMIEKLIDISKINECYKVILNCNEKNKSFYSNCGFTETNTQMSIYFNEDKK